MQTQTKDHEVLEHFPYETFRPDQDRVLIEAAQAIEDGKHVLIEAPVGFGKSPVAYALAHWAGEAIVTTPVNALVDQYETEFGESLSVIKGRRNYPCDRNGETADVGACLTEKGVECECPYAMAKERATMSSRVMTSMAMAMTAPFLRQDRRIVIVDEAHNLEQAVIGNITPSLDPDGFNKQAPGSDDWDAHYDWIDMVAYPDACNALFEAERAYEAIKNRSTLKNLDQARRLTYQLSALRSDFDENGEPWVVTRHTLRNGDKRIKYLPVTGSRFIRSKVLSHGDVGVFMSGTPPMPDELGLEEDEVHRIVTDMPFPLENRPIIKDYRGRMSYKERENTIPKMVDAIAELADGPTIVHAGAYSIARQLSDGLTRKGVGHILQDQQDRMASLDLFTSGSQENPIWISVNMTEGIDLKGDLCRTNILCKVPWPNIRDPWVEKRMEIDDGRLIRHSIARNIAQAYGRAVRDVDDHAKFYILDTSFQYFYNQNRAMFPEYFREAFAGRKKGGGLGAHATAEDAS